jgi:hypothetical protein
MPTKKPTVSRRSPVVVEYEPQWRVVISWILVGTGAMSFIPFTMEWFEQLVPVLGLVLVAGILGLLTGFQTVGWRLELVSNTLYYQKFNLYSNWKQRRSKEYTLNSASIDRVVVEPRIVTISYNGNKQLVFHTLFSDVKRTKRLQELSKRLTTVPE